MSILAIEEKIALTYLLKRWEKIIQFCKNFPKQKIVFTEEDMANFWSEKTCHICGDELSGNKNYCKIRDHCHYMGKYWGAAHSVCNLCYRGNCFLLKMAHNISAYDNHLILSEISVKTVKSSSYLRKIFQKVN